MAWFPRKKQGGTDVLFELVAANQADFPVRTMCRVLKVSSSGIYAWRDRPPSRWATDHAVLTERIRQIHVASDDNCSSPDIHLELRDEGTRVVHKREPIRVLSLRLKGATLVPFCDWRRDRIARKPLIVRLRGRPGLV